MTEEEFYSIERQLGKVTFHISIMPFQYMPSVNAQSLDTKVRVFIEQYCKDNGIKASISHPPEMGDGGEETLLSLLAELWKNIGYFKLFIKVSTFILTKIKSEPVNALLKRKMKFKKNSETPPKVSIWTSTDVDTTLTYINQETTISTNHSNLIFLNHDLLKKLKCNFSTFHFEMTCQVVVGRLQEESDRTSIRYDIDSSHSEHDIKRLWHYLIEMPFRVGRVRSVSLVRSSGVIKRVDEASYDKKAQVNYFIISQNTIRDLCRTYREKWRYFRTSSNRS